MRDRHPLPGFGLSLGLGMAWLGVVVARDTTCADLPVEAF